MAYRQNIEKTRDYSNTKQGQPYKSDTDSVTLNKNHPVVEKLKSLSLPDDFASLKNTKIPYAIQNEINSLISKTKPEKNAEYYYLCGKYYIAINQLSYAIACLNQALVYEKENTKILHILAKCYIAMNSLQNAEETYKQIIQKNPNDKYAKISIGELYKKRKLFNKAIKYFEELINENPNFYDAWLRIGEIYESEGLYDKAEKAYIKASGSIGDQVAGLVRLASLYSKLKKKEEAREIFEKVIEIDNKNEAARDFLIDYYFNKGLDLSDTTFGRRTIEELEEAKRCLEKALHLNPENPDIRGKLSVRLKSVRKHLEERYRK